VITHCLVDSSVAVLDDGEARASAQSHGIPLIGTLGIVLRARKQNLIPVARPLIDQLFEVGSRLDRDLIEQALKQVGE
jgi:predicted nucleic acid-binding protein